MTLTPSATELVVEVAGRDTVVGYDRYSDQLALELEPKPMVVGDFLSPSFEAIVRLRPQLVVADALQDKVVQGLKAAEIPTLALPMHTVEDVWQGALAVGDATGHRARAAQVVAAGRATISRARQRGQRRSKR
ncbi:MAG: ABC transporter substrate-binding protein, partial [Deltaproteobacteria bacterium]|nr:ABC transporter substrate-binding protein [Deltaproteobacteria bacterium]